MLAPRVLNTQDQAPCTVPCTMTHRHMNKSEIQAASGVQY
jgi:hypothetical protein